MIETDLLLRVNEGQQDLARRRTQTGRQDGQDRTIEMIQADADRGFLEILFTVSVPVCATEIAL